MFIFRIVSFPNAEGVNFQSYIKKTVFGGGGLAAGNRAARTNIPGKVIIHTNSDS